FRAARTAGVTHLFAPTLGLKPAPLDAGVPVFELLGAPPSVPGLRLQARLHQALQEAGVQVQNGVAAAEALPGAGAVVLATCRFIGGGIRSDSQLRETVFGLPACAGERTALPPLAGEELFAVKASGRHAGLSAGIRVGPGLRTTANLKGAPVFAAGAVIG